MASHSETAKGHGVRIQIPQACLVDSYALLLTPASTMGCGIGLPSGSLSHYRQTMFTWQALVEQSRPNVYDYLWIADGYQPEPWPPWSTEPIVVHPLMSQVTVPANMVENESSLREQTPSPKITSDRRLLQKIEKSLAKGFRKALSQIRASLLSESIYSFGLSKSCFRRTRQYYWES